MYCAGSLPGFTEWISSLDEVDVFDLMDFTLSGQGFIKGDKLFAFLKTEFRLETKIEDLPIPYVAIAGDITTRQAVEFHTGKLSDAVRASIAIPSIITPVFVKNMVLVDGGVVSPIPAAYIKRHPGDIMVIVDINANIPYVKPAIKPRPPKEHEYSFKRKLFEFVRENTNFFTSQAKPGANPGYIEVLNKTFDIMQDSVCALTKKTYGADLCVEISRDSASTFEFYRADELIEGGRIAFRKTLASSKFAN
jgi:NTE family protein